MPILFKKKTLDTHKFIGKILINILLIQFMIEAIVLLESFYTRWFTLSSSFKLIFFQAEVMWSMIYFAWFPKFAVYLLFFFAFLDLIYIRMYNTRSLKFKYYELSISIKEILPTMLIIATMCSTNLLCYKLYWFLSDDVAREFYYQSNILVQFVNSYISSFWLILYIQIFVHSLFFYSLYPMIFVFYKRGKNVGTKKITS